MVFRSNHGVVPTETGIARLGPIISRFRGHVAFWVGGRAEHEMLAKSGINIAPRVAPILQVALRLDPTRVVTPKSTSSAEVHLTLYSAHPVVTSLTGSPRSM